MVKIFNIDSLESVTIDWTVYKGSSGNKECFSRCKTFVYLIYDDEKIPIECIGCTDKISVSLPKTLAVGVYSIKAVWMKEGKTEKMAVSEVQRAFAVTDVAEEATPYIGDKITLKVKSYAATYGYDGLDAYEMSVMKGRTLLSEEEWLDRLNKAVCCCTPTDNSKLILGESAVSLYKGHVDIGITAIDATATSYEFTEGGTGWTASIVDGNKLRVNVGDSYNIGATDIVGKIKVKGTSSNGGSVESDVCAITKMAVTEEYSEITASISYATISATTTTATPSVSASQSRYIKSGGTTLETTSVSSGSLTKTFAKKGTYTGTVNDSTGAVSGLSANTGYTERTVMEVTMSVSGLGGKTETKTAAVKQSGSVAIMYSGAHTDGNMTSVPETNGVAVGEKTISVSTEFSDKKKCHWVAIPTAANYKVVSVKDEDNDLVDTESDNIGDYTVYKVLSSGYIANVSKFTIISK